MVFYSLTDCQDLDYNEETGNTKEEIFIDFARSKSFVTGIYSYLPTDFNSIDGAIRSAATDDAEHVNDVSNIQKFNEGSYNAVEQLDNVWATMYSAIRAANVYLKESEGQQFKDLEYTNNYKILLQQYNNYPFEVRFLRAYFYFELVKRYKNIPLITTVLTPEEAASTKQASFQEVVEYIVKECDAVAAVLPLDYTAFAGVNETGRATKGAALALKSRVLLYAASPLHNNPMDVTLWKRAAAAAKEVIDLNVYLLEGGYITVVNNLSSALSKELIFERREGASNSFETRNTPVGFQGGNTGTCPTQNLVDSYEMIATGLPITEQGSRYNPAAPYSGRDRRMALTVMFNGSSWKGTPIQSYVGGRNGFPITNATKTGYYLRKYMTESINLDSKLGPVTTRERNWTIFRYGEILLNYAEAMNEAYGPSNPSTLNMTALQAVNLVRRRAGMPNFPATLSPEAFRIKLQNERRVELAFEDHRFWDLRRWKIAEQTKNIFAMKITLDANLAPVYEKKLLEVRSFDENRNYLYPIPQSEIFRNKNLIQNPGY
jgi:hypothetical protein